MTALDQMAERYHAALVDGSPALSYLLGRGISQRSIDLFRLGVVTDEFPEHRDFSGRISVPYDTPLGGVKGFKFRRVGDDDSVAKYVSDYMPTRLYNPAALGRAEQLGYIALNEGESDTWTVDGECGIPAVGFPGIETWKQHKEWPHLFDGFDRVIVFRDMDDAGEKAARWIRDRLDNALVVSLPLKDVNLTYLKYGREFVRNAAGIDS